MKINDLSLNQKAEELLLKHGSKEKAIDQLNIELGYIESCHSQWLYDQFAKEIKTLIKILQNEISKKEKNKCN